MRQRLVALTAAATIAAISAAPAFADTSTSSVPAARSLFSCKVNASLTENGKQVYSISRTFTSRADLSGNYNRSYTFGGVTYTVTANVSCSR